MAGAAGTVPALAYPQLLMTPHQLPAQVRYCHYHDHHHHHHHVLTVHAVATDCNVFGRVFFSVRKMIHELLHLAR